MHNDIALLSTQATQAKTLRLFLDYDGTLAEFAPSPDIVLPDPEVISLLQRLCAAPGLLPAIISGRRLAHIRKLLPLPGLLLAGTYGMEMQLPDGQARNLLPYQQVRPTLENLLPRWRAAIEGRKGFYLEDKGWSLALHGRFADIQEAETVLQQARDIAAALPGMENFHLKEGERFLELAPLAASKAHAVRWVMDELTPPGANSLYIGDDDKDEEAFAPLIATGGWAMRVSTQPVATRAQYQLQSPAQVRAWLNELLAARAA